MKSAGMLSGPANLFDEIYPYAWFTGFLLAGVIYLGGLRFVPRSRDVAASPA
jgi:nucleobase:cation symporter-1, NCS1 family